MILLIIVCWSLLLYAWLAYPLILKYRCGRPAHAGSMCEHAPSAPPSIAVLFSAHNEEKHIESRLRNLLSLDYPADKLVVRVGADGCNDGTVEIARESAARHPNILVHEVPRRRGKAAMLKDLVSQSSESILVFTDANAAFRPDALKMLLRHFGDPAVGGVCGRLIFISAGQDESHGSTLPDPHTPGPAYSRNPILPHSDTSPESAYWRWETNLKQRESALDSCLGGNGAIYAVRRGLFWEDLPENTIIDDFVIGMKVREQGFRMVYEPAALAHESLPGHAAHEWSRRARIGAGGYQALMLCRACLLPRYGAFAWSFWSHKVLRWFTPHLMLALLIAGWGSVLARGNRPWSCNSMFGYLTTPTIVTAVMAAWALAGMLRHLAMCPEALRLVDHFMSMQAALFAGFLRFCRGNLKGYWSRTPRG